MVKKDKNNLKISVVLSFLNEENTLLELITRLRAVFKQLINKKEIGSYELVFINDNSVDNSETIIKSQMIKKDIVLINMSRNFGVSECVLAGFTNSKGDIIIYMDDDDYYPPDRISHAVNMLTTHPSALCAGASEIYIWFKHIQQMYQFGPYGPNHATAGTFSFKRELLKDHSYEEHAALAEEKAFLKNYSVPFVQLEPKKTILVFSHNQNTFDKKRLLENGENRFQKKSDKTVDEFVKELDIRDFFMNKIDKLLVTYEPGEPKNKPDVLKQIKEIEEQRKKMNTEQNSSKIVVNQNGKNIELNNQQVVEILKQQQEQIRQLINAHQEKDKIILKLQNQIDNLKTIDEQKNKILEITNS